MTPPSRSQAKDMGLAFYFTGKPCSHGHIDKRRTSDAKCFQCDRDSALRYYNKNKGSCNARAKAWRADNLEHSAEYKRKYQAENVALIHVARRNKYIRSRDRVIEKSRLWAKANPERRAEITSSWKENNQQRTRDLDRTAKARRRSAAGSHTADEANAIRTKQKNKCIYCKCKLNKVAHLDHIIPLSKGGTNWPDNLQWLCAPCNLDKRAKDPIDYAQSQGMLL